MIAEFRYALPMLARLKASIKFWKFNQLSGRVITLVLWYSASVLNAVMTQDTMGKSATKEKNTRLKYLITIQMTAPAL